MRKHNEKKNTEKSNQEPSEIFQALLDAKVPNEFATQPIQDAITRIAPERRGEAIDALKEVSEAIKRRPALKNSNDLKEYLGQVFLPKSLAIFERAPKGVAETFDIALELIPKDSEGLLSFLDQSYVNCLLLFAPKYEVLEDAARKVLGTDNDIYKVSPPEEIGVASYSLNHEVRETLRLASDKATKDGAPFAGELAGVRGIIEGDRSLGAFLLSGNYRGTNVADLAGSLLDSYQRYPLSIDLFPCREELRIRVSEINSTAMDLWRLSQCSPVDAVQDPSYRRILGGTPLVSRAIIKGSSAEEFGAYVHGAIALPGEDLDSCEIDLRGDIYRAFEGGDRPFDVTISPLRGGVPISLQAFFTPAEEFQGYCPAKISNGMLIVESSPLFSELESLILNAPLDAEDGLCTLVRTGDIVAIHRDLSEEPIASFTAEELESYLDSEERKIEGASFKTTGNGETTYIVHGSDISDTFYHALEYINAVRGSSKLPHIDNLFVTNGGISSSGFLPPDKASKLLPFDAYVREIDDPFLLACELVALDRRGAFFLSGFSKEDFLLESSAAKSGPEPIIPGMGGSVDGVELLIGSAAVADFVCDALRMGYVSRYEARNVVTGLYDLGALERNLRPHLTESVVNYFETFRAKVTALNESLKLEDTESEASNPSEDQSITITQDPSPIAELRSVKISPAYAKGAEIRFSSLENDPLLIWSSNYREKAEAEIRNIGELTRKDTTALSDRTKRKLEDLFAIQSVPENFGRDPLLGEQVERIASLIDQAERLFSRLEEKRINRHAENDPEDTLSGLRQGLRKTIQGIFDYETEAAEDSGFEGIEEDEDQYEQYGSSRFNYDDQAEISEEECERLVDLVLDNDREGFLAEAYEIARRIRIGAADLYLEDAFEGLREDLPEINADENRDEITANFKTGQIKSFLVNFIPENLSERYTSAFRYVVDLARSPHYEKRDVAYNLGKILERIAQDGKLELSDIFSTVEKKAPEEYGVPQFSRDATTARLVASDPDERYTALLNRIVSSLPTKFLLASASRIFQTDPDEFIEAVGTFGIREDELQSLSLNITETMLLAMELHGPKEEETLAAISQGISISPFEFVEKRLAQMRSYMSLRPQGENPVFDNAVLYLLPASVTEQALKGLVGRGLAEQGGFDTLRMALEEFYGEKALRKFLHNLAWEAIRTFFDAEAHSDDTETEEEESDLKALRDTREALHDLGVDTSTKGINAAKAAIGMYSERPEALPPTASFKDLQAHAANGPKALAAPKEGSESLKSSS